LPSNLITTFFMISVGFAVAMLIFLAPPLVITKIDMSTIAHNAARVYAITGNVQDVQYQINSDLQNENLPTTWNGQTLFSVTALSNGQSGSGYSVTSSPSSTTATVVVQYNAPLAFDRALTLFGGPAFNATVPMQAKGSYWNEVQYTGTTP